MRMTDSYIEAVLRTGQRVRFRRYPNLPEEDSPFDGVGRIVRAIPDKNHKTVWGYHIDLRIFDDGRCDKSEDLYFPHQVFSEDGQEREGSE